MKISKRCGWCSDDPLYTKYHDEEWGKQVKDDQILFEFLILESAQAGLSWITILKKRENYRKAFAQFNPNKVAEFTDADIDKLLQNRGIIRNKLKIKAAVENAKLFLIIQEEYGSFYNFLYSFMPDKKQIKNHFASWKDVPASTELSISISKALKRKGFKFFGPVICYAYMQAIGMVNDHEETCLFR